MSASRFLFFLRSACLPTAVVIGGALLVPTTAQAQAFRFTLRAEPDVIPANGISTTSIFVQVPQNVLGNGGISAAPVVRFATTAGVIESQAQLSGGVARVLLRSTTKSETAVVTAFIGSSRESITVEFSQDAGVAERYLEIAAPYTAYGAKNGVITASGKTVLDFGDTRIESDVRLDVDLYSERIWAQGNSGAVRIRQGRGAKAKELRGDRLFYDLRRRRGVIRRGEGDNTNSPTGARQEFVGSNFLTPSGEDADPKPTAGEGKTLLAPPATSSTTEDSSGSPARLIVPPPPSPDSGVTPAPDVPPALSENEPIAPVTVVPGSLADTPATPQQENTLVTPRIVARPDDNTAEAPVLSADVPGYGELDATGDYEPKIVELPPPTFDATNGYWVTARRLRVFPRDKVQFERASIYFNGKKAYGVPTYVLPLDGSFDPATDLVAFNSAGGVSLKFPFYYQASKNGTGSLTLRHEPGGGFGTTQRGLSLELNQQYYLNPRSSGKLAIDQLGRGDWNVNWKHEHQFNATTSSSLYLSMPRHRDVFARANLVKEMRSVQLGLEAFYDRPEDEEGNVRSQFYARMRPRTIGKSGWNYSTSANLISVQRVAHQVVDGGVGLPGQGGTRTEYRSLLGQTLSANLQSPVYQLWKGAQLNGTLTTTAFNYSDGRQGVAPGVTLGLAQRIGSKIDMRLDYTYDRSSLGLYGATSDSFTHYVSGALGVNFSKKLGLSAFASKSLRDDSLYGTTDLNYYFAKKWRAALFADYSDFGDNDDPLNYGWTIGRSFGPREISLNWDALRQKVYLEIGQSRY